MEQKKYVLTEEQVKVLKDVHKKVVENGLIRVGIPFTEQERFVDSSDKTFDLIIKESQEILESIGEKREIMNELK